MSMPPATGSGASRRSARGVLPVAAALFLAGGLTVAGCASASPGAGALAAVDTAAVRGEVTAFLQASARDWNRDDLDAFIATYTEGELAFVGGESVVRSREQVRANYERSYFGGDTEPPDLRFTDLEVRPLGTTHALAFGRWTLYLPGFEEQQVTGTGWFSLVLERHEGSWRIVHDHSS